MAKKKKKQRGKRRNRPKHPPKRNKNKTKRGGGSAAHFTSQRRGQSVITSYTRNSRRNATVQPLSKHLRRPKLPNAATMKMQLQQQKTILNNRNVFATIKKTLQQEIYVCTSKKYHYVTCSSKIIPRPTIANINSFVLRVTAFHGLAQVRCKSNGEPPDCLDAHLSGTI